MQNDETSPNEGCIITILVQENIYRVMERVTVAFIRWSGRTPSLKTGMELCFAAWGFGQLMRLGRRCRTGVLARVLEAFSIDLVK